MKKIIGVIGNPPLNKELLKHIDKENIVVNNHEVKDFMRKQHIEEYLNFFNKNVKTSNYLENFDKPKSKYHK